jgi:type I restriction enzyme S subunit
MDAAVVAAAAADDGATEGPWALPEGWCWVPLGEVLDPISTIDPKRAYGQQSFHYIDLSALEHGRVTKAQLIAGDEAPSRARQIVQTGDTLFSCVRVYLENIALLDVGLSNPVASTAYCVMRPTAVVDPRYLNYFVRSRRFIEWMIPLQRGNSPPAVLDGDLKAQAFPLAPLAEQRHIVERVDVLFAEIAEGEAALAEARKGLDIFRRALLKAAVTGELTKDWRAVNPPTETSDDLLARIKIKRTGKGSPKAGARRAIDANPLDTSSLPQLPDGWAWATLSDLVISGPTNGYSPKKSTDGSGTLALKLTATTKGQIDLTVKALKSLSETIPPGSDLYLKPGDLLFQRGNTVEYVGIAAVYEGPSDKYVYPDLMIRARTVDSWMANWIWRVANSPFGRKYMMDRASGTAGTMPKINGEILRNFPVPIPPQTEINEILCRIAESFAACADTLTALDAEAADAARLKQSILKAAFEGLLVPQDPGDEPASARLARSIANPSAMRTKRRPLRKSNA